jgi:hypothetical protein
MMNKKGQGFGFIRVIFFAIFFVIIFALALAPFVTTAMGASDLTVLGGFGEWAMSNLALWIFLVFILVVFVALIYGFSSE